MDSRNDCLAHYPFVVVGIACRVCSRSGSYRLARLAAKFGPEISLRDLTDRFSYDCLWRAEARSKRGVSACGVYLPDLEQPRPRCAARDGEAAARQERVALGSGQSEVSRAAARLRSAVGNETHSSNVTRSPD
jgi:hypothetical protein